GLSRPDGWNHPSHVPIPILGRGSRGYHCRLRDALDRRSLRRIDRSVSVLHIECPHAGERMRSVNRSNRGEKGAVLVLVAAALLVLTGMAAIAIDGGLAYNERRSTQNAADNAALAGAWALCRGEDAAQAALDSAQLNGYTPPQVDAPQIDGDTVTVRIQADISTTFGRAQGVGELGVISEARARCTLGGGGGEWLGLPAILSVGSGCGPVTLGNNGDSNGLIYSASGLVLKNNNDIHGPVYTEGDLVVQNNVELYGPVHSNANLTINNNAKHHHPSNATYVGTLTKGNNTST